MNRRGFLRLLGLSAAGALAPDLTLDPERALWVPGAKTFFLPSPPEIHEVSIEVGPACQSELDAAFDAFFTPDWITREALRVLKNKLTVADYINRDYEEARLLPPRLLHIG